MNRKTICIIIPAYNEEKRIRKTLEEYCNFLINFKKQRTLDFKIIVVINNTKDRTEEIVKEVAKVHKEIGYLNFISGGKGFATIEGFKAALKDKNNELIGFVDADMATPPHAFYSLIENLNDYDGIIASRYMNGAVVNPKQSLQRIIVSRMFNFLVRALFFFPYADTQCGAKIFRRKTIEKIILDLTVSKWAFDVDLLYQIKNKNLRIKEYPTVWSDKEYSKINFKKAGPLMALAVIRLRIINSPFKGIIRLYDKLPEGIKIYHKMN